MGSFLTELRWQVRRHTGSDILPIQPTNDARVLTEQRRRIPRVKTLVKTQVETPVS